MLNTANVLIGMLVYCAIKVERDSLGCTGVVPYLCFLGKMDKVHVFDERSERPLSFDSFGVTQEGLNNLTDCVQAVEKDISCPFLMEGEAGLSEEFR